MAFATGAQSSGTRSLTSIKDRYYTREYPAWTGIGVTYLAMPGLMVEIKCVAYSKNRVIYVGCCCFWFSADSYQRESSRAGRFARTAL